ncbi:MAG: hydantoinase/oxoprolinase family protein, partial [Dehalococcoidia bacterium]
MRTLNTLSIGVDIGGTFTDVVAVDTTSRSLLYTKVNSTPPELVDGFLQGVDRALAMASASYPDLSRVVHGTTVGTNAILEAKGAPIGILVTEGFEDVLAIGRQKRSDMYDVFLSAETPVFLTPRRRIVGIRERLYPDGSIDVSLDEEGVARAVDNLVHGEGVEAIAVCYLFSFANPTHEERTRKIILERHPVVRVSLSSSLDPRFREYERLCLTAFDAYLRPIVERYIEQIQAELSNRGAKARFQIMHSRGGITSDETILNNTVSTVLSGPAAGVVGGVFTARLSGLEEMVTLDMGGTSCDIALVEKGKPILSSEGKIARYPLRQPMLDINTIGAGGGSIGWIDEGGLLRMGPQSSGANPGPACYDLAGDLPTCTDADLVLGYLDKDFFAGGRIPLNLEKSQRAIQEYIAKPLKLDLYEAAAGMYNVINVNMAAAIREVSVKQGFDPRDFPLVVAGGAGPNHACMIALELEI